MLPSNTHTYLGVFIIDFSEQIFKIVIRIQVKMNDSEKIGRFLFISRILNHLEMLLSNSFA